MNEIFRGGGGGLGLGHGCGRMAFKLGELALVFNLYKFYNKKMTLHT